MRSCQAALASSDARAMPRPVTSLARVYLGQLVDYPPPPPGNRT